MILQTRRREIPLSCGEFTSTAEHRNFFALIYLYWGRETTLTSTCEKMSEICHNTYRDTVEKGSTLGKSGIHDTQFDAKAPKPTPKNRKIDALQNSRSGRLCRPL